MKWAVGLLGLVSMAAAAGVVDRRAAPGVPVTEVDFLAVLESRVKEADRAGLFAEKRRAAAARFTTLTRRPVALYLAQADTPRTWSKVLVSAETLADTGDTAAAVTTLQRTYLFIDADDAAERRWAKTVLATVPAARLVAVAGDLIRAAEKRTPETLAGIRLYADQGGSLVRRFGVLAHPARVTLAGTSAGVVMTASEIPLSRKDIER